MVGAKRLKFQALHADAHGVKAFLILILSMAALAIGVSPVLAQDSAYPPRLISISVSDTPVEAGAPFSVTVDGCHVGQTVDFTLVDVTVQVLCAQPEAHQSSLVLKAIPARATAEFTAPSVASDYVGNARVAAKPDPVDLTFALEVIDASSAFELTAAQGARGGTAPGSFNFVAIFLVFVLAAFLASGFWIVYRSD